MYCSLFRERQSSTHPSCVRPALSLISFCSCRLSWTPCASSRALEVSYLRIVWGQQPTDNMLISRHGGLNLNVIQARVWLNPNHLLGNLYEIAFPQKQNNWGKLARKRQVFPLRKTSHLSTPFSLFLRKGSNLPFSLYPAWTHCPPVPLAVCLSLC